jgi:hypothetical protein
MCGNSCRGGCDKLLLSRGELKRDLLAGELLVDRRDGAELVLNVRAILLLQVDLVEAGAIETHANALADDLCGREQILYHQRDA